MRFNMPRHTTELPDSQGDRGRELGGLPQRFHWMRQRHGLTQAEVACNLHIGQPTISRFEKGNTHLRPCNRKRVQEWTEGVEKSYGKSLARQPTIPSVGDGQSENDGEFVGSDETHRSFLDVVMEDLEKDIVRLVASDEERNLLRKEVGRLTPTKKLELWRRSRTGNAE